MAQLTVTHTKVSAIADDPVADAAGEVVPSDWNANHTLAGTEIGGYDIPTMGAKLAGLPSTAISDVGDDGTTSTTGRGRINFTGAAVVTDNAGTNSKDVAISGYSLQFLAGNLAAPADSTTYYMGCLAAAPSSTAALARVYIQKAGSIKLGRFTVRNTGTGGTTETSTVSVRLNNTTDTEISAAVTTDQTFQSFTSGALAVAVAAGDYVEIKWVTPAWVTNPTNLLLAGQLYIE